MTAAAPTRAAYPSDLTDAQWRLLEPFVKVDEARLGPQEVIHSRREIVNAILYQTRTGCQWRYLPHDLPDWQSVYHYFRLWKKNGVLKRMHDTLRDRMRVAEGRNVQPTAAIIDSQSAKSTEEAETRGYDAAKKVKGRKRHLLVDVLGLLLVAWITPGDVQDRDALPAVFPLAVEEFPQLQLVWADSAYRGDVVDTTAAETGLRVEVVQRTDDMRGFVVLPRRWVVERTFGWLNRERRLSKDYERTEESAEAFIYWGMTRLMARRFAT